MPPLGIQVFMNAEQTDRLATSRSALALGIPAMEMLGRVRVMVLGLGGVGSWAAEALVRTGVRHMALVDADCVAVSNVNRQAPATMAAVGMPKTEAMAARLRDIAPDVELELFTTSYCEATASDFDFESYDYVIDAIDSLADKQQLILNAAACRRPVLFSSMGAALKLDPGKIDVAEFWKVHGCPLAAALRSRMRRAGTFPARKVVCVFSPERLPNHPEALDGVEIPDKSMRFGKVAVNGSLCHITATFGLRLASLVVSDLYGRALEGSRNAHLGN